MTLRDINTIESLPQDAELFVYLEEVEDYVRIFDPFRRTDIGQRDAIVFQSDKSEDLAILVEESKELEARARVYEQALEILGIANLDILSLEDIITEARNINSQKA